MLKLWKNSFSCLKDLEKESMNCLECCEKRFMEEWIIKLYSKNNCGLMPYVQDVYKVCTQKAYMKEWIKAYALLVIEYYSTVTG